MHALTVGKSKAYYQLRTSLGPVQPKPPVADQKRKFVRDCRKACETFGVKRHRGYTKNWEQVAAAIAEPGIFGAYTHGDPCPDNTLRADGEMKILDFEFGDFRLALLDGAYGRIHFPTCWCVSRIPYDITLKMESAYRQEFVKGCPQASDDERFGQAVVAACAFFANWSFARVSRIIEKDENDPIITGRQRIILRLDKLAQACEEFGHLQALGETTHDLAEKLCEVWGIKAVPVYPAFEGRRNPKSSK